jgi:hypothetical protein
MSSTIVIMPTTLDISPDAGNLSNKFTGGWIFAHDGGRNPPMSASARYRTLADQAARSAKAATAPHEQAAWRDIAQSWAALAREAEAVEAKAADEASGEAIGDQTRKR